MTKILEQTPVATGPTDSFSLEDHDGGSFQMIWDGNLSASFILQTSNNDSDWFNETSVTISGAEGYPSNVMVHIGNIQSRYARVFTSVTTAAGTLVISAHGKR